VLDGLQYNESASAILGPDEILVNLAGAAPAVEAFRSCTATPFA
jgi:hypothetical protein